MKDPKELDDPQLFDDPSQLFDESQLFDDHQPFDDPQLFDDQLEVWTLIIHDDDTSITDGLVIFYTMEGIKNHTLSLTEI